MIHSLTQKVAAVFFLAVLLAPFCGAAVAVACMDSCCCGEWCAHNCQSGDCIRSAPAEAVSPAAVTSEQLDVPALVAPAVDAPPAAVDLVAAVSAAVSPPAQIPSYLKNASLLI